MFWIVVTILGGLCIVFYRKFLTYVECTSKTKLSGKTVIVTGSNTGIGKATALDLAKRGAHVVLACRDIKKAENAAEEIQHETGYNSKVKVMKLDLGSLSSVREFAEKFKKEEQRLDILVNNAGLLCPSYSISEDGIEMTMAVNHMGHFLLTNLLLEKLKSCAPSRVVSVSALGHTFVSGMNFDDFNLEKSYQSWSAYCRSKLANIMFIRQLAKNLKDTGVTTYALHPGLIKTEFMRNLWIFKIPGMKLLLETITGMIFLNVHQGAQTTIYCCVHEELDNTSGAYYSHCAEAPISAAASDDLAAKRLWDLSEKLTGLVKKD